MDPVHRPALQIHYFPEDHKVEFKTGELSGVKVFAKEKLDLIDRFLSLFDKNRWVKVQADEGPVYVKAQALSDELCVSKKVLKSTLQRKRAGFSPATQALLIKGIKSYTAIHKLQENLNYLKTGKRSKTLETDLTNQISTAVKNGLDANTSPVLLAFQKYFLKQVRNKKNRDDNDGKIHVMMLAKLCKRDENFLEKSEDRQLINVMSKKKNNDVHTLRDLLVFAALSNQPMLQQLLVSNKDQPEVLSDALVQAMSFFTPVQAEYEMLSRLLKENAKSDVISPLFIALKENNKDNIFDIIDRAILKGSDVKSLLKKLLGVFAPESSEYKLLQEILQKGETLSQALDAKYGIVEAEALKIAAFAQLKLKELAARGTTHIKRVDYGLARSLQYDPETESLFVLLKSKEAEDLKNPDLPKGTFKIVKPALFIDAAWKARPAVELVIKDTANMRTVAHEMSILLDPDLQNKEGLPSVIASITYLKRATLKNKTGIMQERFDGDLVNLIESINEKKTTLSPQECISICRQLINGVYALHTHKNKEGVLDPIVHFDLKPDNVLFRIVEDEEGNRVIKVAVTDFGEHFKKFGGKKPPEGRRYATKDYFPPEDPHRIEDYDYLKADMFALGKTLAYVVSAAFGGIPHLMDFYDWKSHKPKKVASDLIDQMEPASLRDQLELLVLGMMNEDPEKRFSIEDAREAILEIENEEFDNE